MGRDYFTAGGRWRARSSKSSATLLKAVSAVAVTLAVAVTTACGSAGGQTASDGDGTPTAGGTLRVVEDVDSLNCVDPFQTAWTATRSVVRNVAESLVDQDPKTGDISPWLAKDWKISDDGKTYTFNLKSGITFSDGEAFNADAVVTTFEGDLATLKAKPGTVGGFYVGNLESVTKVDDDTVKFNLSAPNASFLQGLATTTLAILSPKSFDYTPQERCQGKIVGTGPFTLEKYDVNTETILSKRKGYTSPSPFSTNDGDAYLDKVQISYIPEASVRIGNLVSGAADVIWTDSDSPLVQNDVTQIKQSGGSVQTRSLPGSTYELFPNVRNGGPLSDKKVREAFSLGIDRSTYASTIVRDDYPVVSGVVDTTTPSFSKQSSSVKYDPSEAKKLLDEAGWKVADDGYRYKDGKKLSISFLTTSKDDGAELIQDELKKIGIDYQINVVTSAQYTSLSNANEYDVVSITYTRADPSAINTLLDTRYATFKALTGNTQTDADRKYLEAAFDKGTTQTNADERTATYQDIQKYISDNSILIPVFERVQDAGISSKVKGIRFTAESFSDYSGASLDK
ncbi:ABC transporter substrate-binding protein [Bifidobacterium psychraerophilum]|uniref:Extracellular solute-binding protein family 5 n=1 Tax=Bifidobacterium psychraerophilum TaxID=218140 RepID=A0A087CEH9_9BIFI|nr:ABC transporter substrate-binding protein [Bifidobacterium psychraerophilum]KFI81679.1 extracellular solute-binding protein family 5 [Bifidobacterium psychraerophilum]PKA93932.1 peptide/nickel transport system substrate-binding protein [Bifidobacterium psychraerophilum DSM 22366]